MKDWLAYLDPPDGLGSFWDEAGLWDENGDAAVDDGDDQDDAPRGVSDGAEPWDEAGLWEENEDAAIDGDDQEDAPRGVHGGEPYSGEL